MKGDIGNKAKEEKCTDNANNRLMGENNSSGCIAKR